MDYVEAGGLFPVLAQKSLVTERDMAKVFYRILETLNYIHEKGIVHRDLKPENILVSNISDFETIKIVDFGLSCFMGDKDPIYQRCGTPGFIAPEILNCVSEKDLFFNEKTDVFSLGVMLYIMLTGKSPFAGKSKEEILKNNKLCEINFDIIQGSPEGYLEFQFF